MIEGLAIGLGAGVLGTVTTWILHFLLMRGQQGQLDRAFSRGDALAKRLDTAHEDIGELEKTVNLLKTNESQFQRNELELKREIGTKDAHIRELEARVQSVQKARDDLAKAIANASDHNPGAIPLVVRSAFDRLREVMPDAQDPAPAATGDQNGGEAGRLHEAADDHPPR